MDCGDRVHLIIDGCDMKLTDGSLTYDSVTRLPREQVKPCVPCFDVCTIASVVHSDA